MDQAPASDPANSQARLQDLAAKLEALAIELGNVSEHAAAAHVSMAVDILVKRTGDGTARGEPRVND